MIKISTILPIIVFNKENSIFSLNYNNVKHILEKAVWLVKTKLQLKFMDTLTTSNKVIILLNKALITSDRVYIKNYKSTLINFT